MKLAIIIGLASMISLTGPASAVLSGYWESSIILQRILERNEVADALKQQPVDSIVKTDSGYRIESHNCVVDIQVQRAATNKPGPSEHRISIKSRRCK